MAWDDTTPEDYEDDPGEHLLTPAQHEIKRLIGGVRDPRKRFYVVVGSRVVFESDNLPDAGYYYNRALDWPRRPNTVGKGFVGLFDDGKPLATQHGWGK